MLVKICYRKTNGGSNIQPRVIGTHNPQLVFGRTTTATATGSCDNITTGVDDMGSVRPNFRIGMDVRN